MKSVADWSKHFDNILILLNDISNRLASKSHIVCLITQILICHLFIAINRGCESSNNKYKKQLSNGFLFGNVKSKSIIFL